MREHTNRWLPPALAALSGVLYVAAFPGIGIIAVAPFVFAPLLFALRGVGPSRAAALGALTGVVACGVGFRWMLHVLVRFGEIGTVGAVCVFVLFVLAQASRFAIQAWLTERLSRRAGPYFAAGMAFLAAETLAPSPMQWSFAGALASRIELLQVAELGGPTLACLPLVLASAALVRATLRRQLRWVCVAILPIALSFLYGALRIRGVDEILLATPPITVGIVQGAMPVTGDPVAESRALSEEVRLQRELDERGVALSVWSESSIPVTLHAAHAERELADLLVGIPSVPTILSAEVDEATTPLGVRAYNSALVLDGGHLRSRYDKRTLLPFSERLPFGDVLPWLYRLSPGSSRFTRGAIPGTRAVSGHEVAITICYEDAIASAVQESAEGGRAELLVNLTNDAWFAGSDEPRIHLDLARSRAVEHRRYLVHATSTGLSAVIDPAGRIVAALPQDATGVLVADVRWLHERTLFDVVGERPAWILSMLVVLVALVRRRSDSQPHRDRAITT